MQINKLPNKKLSLSIQDATMEDILDDGRIEDTPVGTVESCKILFGSPDHRLSEIVIEEQAEVYSNSGFPLLCNDSHLYIKEGDKVVRLNNEPCPVKNEEGWDHRSRKGEWEEGVDKLSDYKYIIWEM